MLKNNFALLSIIILAAFLRFYQLGQNPPSLDWDETAHGYNAYSILKTGRDEYGYKMPLSLRSFDDYKPPLYTYLVVPSVAIFGLNNFAVRFPSAFLGVLAILFTYLMVLELLNKKQIALLAALFLAISPWHLQFSRVAFETNSAIFWSVLGTWAFLRGARSKDKKITYWLTFSSLSFGANLFMYHNARVFIPFYAAMLLFLYRQKLLQYKKQLILPAIISVIFIIILIPIITSIAGQSRFKGTTIFADASFQFKDSELIAQDEKNGQLLIGKLFHNRRFVYVPVLIESYLSHLNPTFLFFKADMERHHAPLVGLLYLWDIPFIVAGVYFLIKNKFRNNSKIIIFWWFIVAPIAASVTWGIPHALRSEIYLPIYQVFTALGVYNLYSYSKRKANFAIIAASLLFLNFIFYLHQYYIHMPIEYSRQWLYGRKEAALFTDSIKSGYDRVIVSTKLEQPHEFWLYYLKYDPAQYLKEGGTISGGFSEDRNKFDKYLFKPVNPAHQKQEAKTLFVSTPKEVTGEVKILKTIKYLNGESAIVVFE